MAPEIRPVHSADEREAFIRLPWRLYEDEPHWVPPLLMDLRSRLDPDRHPFHAHSDVQLYLALRDGRPVGRIAAIHNRNHVAHHDEPVGFFGFFESERDPATARALLDAAAAWLRARGLEVIRGPTSFSLNEEAGLLVEGFDGPPAIMMPYNPPWYEDLLLGAGFEEAKTLVAYLYVGNVAPPHLERAERIVRRRHPEIRVRPIRMDRFEEEIEHVRRIYNAAWQENWGFVPMTDEEFRHMARELRPVVEPRFALLAEDAEGRPVGFALALPDLNLALRHLDGRLFPTGLLRFLWHRRSVRRIRVVTLGVVDAYRGTGLDALFYLEIFRAGHDWGVPEGEFSWILEDNVRMCRALEKIGSRVYRRYRLYDRPVSARPTGGEPRDGASREA